MSFPFKEEKGSPLLALLKTYQYISSDSKGLPLVRRHDHRITLKDESQTINLRPYRYFRLQKDTMEKLMAEMLEVGIV